MCQLGELRSGAQTIFMCCKIAGSENAFSQNFLLCHGPELFRDSATEGTEGIADLSYSVVVVDKEHPLNVRQNIG